MVKIYGKEIIRGFPRTPIEAVWCSGADRRSFEASAMPFEKRHAGCEEREKINRRRIYDTLRINFFEATKQTACIFSKGGEAGVIAVTSAKDKFPSERVWIEYEAVR